MKLGNLYDWFVSSVAVGGMVAAVGCSEVGDTNVYNYPPGSRDSGMGPDVALVDSRRDQSDLYQDAAPIDKTLPDTYQADAGVDSAKLDSSADAPQPDSSLDSAVADAQTPDAPKVDVASPDSAVADAKSLDKTLPDTYQVDAASPDKAMAKPDSAVADAKSLDKTLPDTYQVDAASPDKAMAKPDSAVADAKLSDTLSPDYQADAVVVKDGLVSDVSKACPNLSKVPKCLVNYVTLVSSGSEALKALTLGYQNPTTQASKFKGIGIVSGNACTLPKNFSGTCTAYINSYNSGTSTIKLDGSKVKVQGNLLERMVALDMLSKGTLTGTECTVSGFDSKTATYTCSKK